MSPPDDTPPLARLARWSEWWFTPRWRALLTWVVLAGIGGKMSEVLDEPSWYSNMMDKFWATRRSGFSGQFPGFADNMMLLTWIEPFALRLNLTRSAAWLALRLAPLFVYCYANPINGDWIDVAFYLLSPAAILLALLGWRSRPWMCVVGAALSFIAVEWILPSISPFPDWLWYMTETLSFAATLLYGTRLLTPEERAGDTAAK